MSDVPIPGLKLIKFNTQRVDEADDPSYPFKLVVSLRQPELMKLAAMMLYGNTEELVVRAMTLESLQEFIAQNHLEHHPRLIKLVVTDSEGEEVLKIER